MSAVDFGGAFEALARPIQIGLRGPVGSGKTADMIEAIKTALASSSDAACAVFVPNHKLTDEFAARLRTALPAGATVEVWRGQDQPDPNAPAGAARKRCERGNMVRQVREAGGAIEDVCGSKLRGYCPHHPGTGGACGYVPQRRTKARVWIMPHAMLHRGAREICPALRRIRQANASNCPRQTS